MFEHGLDIDIIKTNILTNFNLIKVKMRLPEFKQYFPSIWSSELIFNPILNHIQLGLDIIKRNMMTIFEDAVEKKLASRVITRFSINLT